MCVNFRPVATFFKLKFLTILFRVLDDVSREPATCYRCNAVGHVSTKCRTRDVNCQICKNKQHVTDACYTKRAPRTTAATDGSAPRIHATQETDQQADWASSRSEELWQFLKG